MNWDAFIGLFLVIIGVAAHGYGWGYLLFYEGKKKNPTVFGVLWFGGAIGAVIGTVLIFRALLG